MSKHFYTPINSQPESISEPSAEYRVPTDQVSLSVLGIPVSTFHALTYQAEEDFAQGHYLTSSQLLHKVKTERGWR